MKKKHVSKGKLLLAAASVLLIIGFFADYYVSESAKKLHHPLVLHSMEWFSDVSTMVIVLVIIGSLFLWNEKKKQWMPVAWLSFGLAAVASFALKEILARPRPSMYEGFTIAQYSFPSAHAALAFSLLPVFNREFPHIKLFWTSFAIIIAASRVYLGVHYVSDVIAGAILGYVIGSAVVWTQEKRKLDGMEKALRLK